MDDETKLLDGLRRILHPMRKEWDMVFVASARQALEALALDPFEVIVTDMRMPGMDGAELLDEVVKIYPETVRLVLSGQWDPDMSIRSAKTAHQYVTKPCSAEVLKATLDRIFALRRLLAGRSLKRTVSGMTMLPSLPQAYRKLMETLESPDVTADHIAEVIAGDIAMTAKVLQLANSAFFGVSRKVSHPADATRYLGVDTIKALALTMGVFSEFTGPESASPVLVELQSHTLETGRLAQLIAKAENVEKQMADDAYLAALLHDVGKLILIDKDAEMYESAMMLSRTEKLEIEAVEREMFGAGHSEVGCYLLWLWGLPDTITNAVAFHHRPADCAEKGMSPMALVHIADVLAHEIEPSSEPAPALDEAFLAEAGLSGRMAEWRELAREALHVGEMA